MFTDGLVEAVPESGPPFGVKRVIQAARAYRQKNPQTIINRLHRAVSEHIGSSRQLADDVTIVVAKAEEPLNKG